MTLELFAPTERYRGRGPKTLYDDDGDNLDGSANQNQVGSGTSKSKST